MQGVELASREMRFVHCNNFHLALDLVLHINISTPQRSPLSTKLACLYYRYIP